MLHTYRKYVVGEKPHIVSSITYWLTFLLLIILTIITVLLSKIEIKSYSILIALIIASIKASLVFAIFMHLWLDNKFYTIILISSMLVLSLFIIMPIIDLNSRNWLDKKKTNFLPRNEIIKKYKQNNPNKPPLRPGLIKPKI